MSAHLLLLVLFAYRLVCVARRLQLFFKFFFFYLFSSPFHYKDSVESGVLYKFYCSRENFECGIDDVSVGNLTRVASAAA